MDKIQALIEAHVEFELKHIFDNPESFIYKELEALLENLGHLRLEQIVSKSEIESFILTNEFSMEMPDILIKNIALIFVNFRQFFSEKGIEFKDFIDKEQFRILIENTISIKNIREEIIHQICLSSLYGRFISDILYRGIKNFLLEENIIAKNLPGASMLIGFGRNLMSKLPGVDDGELDEKLIQFVQTNIKQTLLDSERYLNETLEGEFSKVLVDDLWDLLNSMPPGKTVQKISIEELERSVELFIKTTDKFRSSGLYRELSLHIANSVFENIRHLTILDLIVKCGLQNKTLIEQIVMMATPLFKNDSFHGYIEKRLTDRFRNFYESTTCGTILNH